MHHDCGTVAVEQKCCATEASNPTALVPDTFQLRLWQHAVVAVGHTPPGPGLSALVRTVGLVHSSTPRSPHTPTYLSASVFRI